MFKKYFLEKSHKEELTETGATTLTECQLTWRKSQRKEMEKASGLMCHGPSLVKFPSTRDGVGTSALMSFRARGNWHYLHTFILFISLIKRLRKNECLHGRAIGPGAATIIHLLVSGCPSVV